MQFNGLRLQFLKMRIGTRRIGPLNATLGPARLALFVILFVAILVLGFLVPLRYAHGWLEKLREGQAIMAPGLADGMDVRGNMHRRLGESGRANAWC